MMSTQMSSPKIDKQHVAAMSSFLLQNIPASDEYTLSQMDKLLRLTGKQGYVTVDQFLNLIKFSLDRLPDICPHTLFLLVELLSSFLPLEASVCPRLQADDSRKQLIVGSLETCLCALSDRRPQ